MKTLNPSLCRLPFCCRFVLAFLASGAMAWSQTQIVIVPGDLASTEGNINNVLPFDIAVIPLASERYQQVYDASLFSALPAGGALITGLSFRVDGTYGGSFSSTLPEIQLNLSTTGAGEETLSATFANNIGGNDTMVFARGSLPLSGTGGSSPNAFNVTIMFSQPFIYNPAAGNLLLDVRNFGGGTTTAFDAIQVPGDGISRVITFTGLNVDSPVASMADTSGLVTEFIFQPVPEPAVFALAVLGLATLWLFHRSRRRLAAR